jgi:type IV pilus assembly protein PilZ
LDLRRFPRVRIDQPVLFSAKGEEVSTEGIARDISLGGMFVATEVPAPFGAEVTVEISLGGSELVIPGVVRWTRPDGMGVQFGLLGARETFAITEIVKRKEGG